MSVSYLDSNGLLYFWQKIKNVFAKTTDIPTKTSDLTNDSGFITSSDIPEGAAASTTTPYMDGTASVGTELAFARGDHRHPSDTAKLDKSGGTMTGMLTLSGAPTNNLHAATKKYVDDNIPTNVSELTNDAGYTTNTGTITGITMNGSSMGTSGVVNLGTVITSHQDISGKLDKSGGTMTGNLTLAGAPTSNLHAATKKYVDDLDTAMDSRVDALEAAVGTGGSVDTKITNAINELDSNVSASDGYALKGVTITNGKISNSSSVELTAENISVSDIEYYVGDAENVSEALVNLSELISDVSTGIGDLAPKASPMFTGTPTAPTATAGTNNTQIATTAFVTSAVATAIGGITGISYEIVASLPATGDAGVIYLLANSGTSPNIYDEYIYVNNAFEKIGTTEVDLSGYVQTSDLVAITNAQIDTIVAS